jgi:hypothetical protein
MFAPGVKEMMDILYLGVVVLFFVATWGLAGLCSRL